MLVVRLVTEHVGKAVDTPRDVETENEAEHAADKEGCPGGLAPEVPGDDGGEHEAHEDQSGQVQSATRAHGGTFNIHGTDTYYSSPSLI